MNINEVRGLISQINELHCNNDECDTRKRSLNGTLSSEIEQLHVDYFLGRGSYFSDPSKRMDLVNKIEEVIKKNISLISQISSIEHNPDYQRIRNEEDGRYIDWFAQKEYCTSHVDFFKKHLEELPLEPCYQSVDEAIKSIKKVAKKNDCKRGNDKNSRSFSLLNRPWLSRHGNGSTRPYLITQSFDYLTRNISNSKEAKKVYDLGKNLGIISRKKICASIYSESQRTTSKAIFTNYVNLDLNISFSRRELVRHIFEWCSNCPRLDYLDCCSDISDSNSCCLVSCMTHECMDDCLD